MESIAPTALSEAWDNTGLLLGDANASVERVQTCLTLTTETVAEAVARSASLVISHHPLPFKPLARITTSSQAGRLIWELSRAGISVYSPHTSWDSAERGINALLAEKLQLRNVCALIPAGREEFSSLGAGRIGDLGQSTELQTVTQDLLNVLPNCRPRGVDCGRAIRRIAVACGSGGSLLAAAGSSGCDLFVTGEATFHMCLEAQAMGISLLMVGHFASEHFAMQDLAEWLKAAFPTLDVWPSKNEKDPVRNFL